VTSRNKASRVGLTSGVHSRGVVGPGNLEGVSLCLHPLSGHDDLRLLSLWTWHRNTDRLIWSLPGLKKAFKSSSCIKPMNLKHIPVQVGTSKVVRPILIHIVPSSTGAELWKKIGNLRGNGPGRYVASFSTNPSKKVDVVYGRFTPVKV
jgi:hypothetical protein